MKLGQIRVFIQIRDYLFEFSSNSPLTVFLVCGFRVPAFRACVSVYIHGGPFSFTSIFHVVIIYSRFEVPEFRKFKCP